jgi:hypothetical protein
MIKNWQNENKKNKNPPPMPDFNKPRMKKPDLVLVTQESGRPIVVRLLSNKFDIQSKSKEKMRWWKLTIVARLKSRGRKMRSLDRKRSRRPKKMLGRREGKRTIKESLS